MPARSGFEQSIQRQIAINRARTPTERFNALCDLLDAGRAMAPTDPAALERMLRVKTARQREKELWRAEYRRLYAANRPDSEPGV